MTLLAALQSASTRLIGRRPTAFFAASGGFEAELCDLVNEVATDVAKYRDWTELQRVATLTGDGSADAFDLPDDYDRMMVLTDVQDSQSWLWGYRRFTDLNQYMFEQARGFQPFPGGWIITGGQIKFAPVVTAGQTARFPYISSYWAMDTAAKPVFTADGDTFLLPERLLTLGLVWRWRENKKLDASGDQEAFIKALDEYAGKDGGSRVYRYGGGRSVPGVRVAWPWALGPA